MSGSGTQPGSGLGLDRTMVRFIIRYQHRGR
jgi:hypothetical protein